MATRIVGLDLGTRSIKLLELDTQGELEVVTFDEEPLALGEQHYRLGGGPAVDEASSGGEETSGDEASGGSANGTEADDTSSTGEEPAVDPTAGLPNIPWVHALARLLARHEFSSATSFVTFLPAGRAISIHQEIPFAESSKVVNILPHMLQDRLPLDPDEIVYDFEILKTAPTASGPEDGDGEENENLAVVGIGRKEHIREFLDELKEVRVNPKVVGVPELMLRYAAEATVPLEKSTYAVVDIGHRFTRVLVLDDGRPMLARSIQMGGATITDAVAEEFDMGLEEAEEYKRSRGEILSASAAEDRESLAFSETVRDALAPLVRDLRRSFQSLYAKRRVRLETIYLTGGTSEIENLEDHLADEFGLPVESLPLDRALQMRGGDMPLSDLSSSGMVVSLALQQARDRQEDRLLNLRKDEFSYSGASSFVRKQLARFGAVAAILLVLLLGALFSEKLELESKANAMETALGEQTQQVFGESIYSIDKIKTRLRGETGQAGSSYVPKMSAYQVFYEISSRISNDMKLTLDRLDVDTERNIIQVDGATSSAQAVDRLVTDLEKFECLRDIQKSQLRVRNETKADFKLEISSQCS